MKAQTEARSGVLRQLRARGPRGFLRLAADEMILRSRARLNAPLLAAARRTGRPVLVGPFLGEVGFEVLYWVPFVRRILEERGVERHRVVAVSRGGATSWYRGLADRYLDAVDLLGAEDFAQSLDERRANAGDQKQVRVAPLDRRLAAAARSSAGISGSAVSIHPAVMHRQLRDLWAGRRSPDEAERLLRFGALPLPETRRPTLPPDAFVALKAYENQALPQSSRNRRWIVDLAAVLSSQLSVVNPVNRVPIDGHTELPVGDDGVLRIDAGAFPGQGLALHSNVFGRAAVAVSTYGGMAYVPMFHGVPTVALTAADGYNPVHLEVARIAAARLGVALRVVDMRQTTPTEAAELVLALAGPRALTRPN